MVRDFTGTDNSGPPWFKWTIWKPFWFPVFWPCHWKGWLLTLGWLAAMKLSEMIAAAVFSGDAGKGALTAIVVTVPILIAGYLHAEAV